MRRSIYLVALAIALAGAAPAEERERDKDRVRAKKPTVVTVEGKADSVDAKREEMPQSLGAKVTGGVKRGVVKTWNGIVDFAGWLVNDDDEINAEQADRSKANRSKKDKP